MSNITPELPPNLLEGWQIVVVDDEPDSLEVAQIILEAYGATVHTASNGAEGLALVKSVRPKLVISDISMPVMDGWGFAEAIKNDRTTMDIPMIALTAHAMPGDREKAIAAGFHNHLTKPLTVDSFIHDLIKLLVEIPAFADQLKV